MSFEIHYNRSDQAQSPRDAGPNYSYPLYAVGDGVAEGDAPVPGFVCHRCGSVVAHRGHHNQFHEMIDYLAGTSGAVTV